jgi:hypothetical protein
MSSHGAESARELSIEIFDSSHRKFPFEEGIDSDHIEDRPDRVGSDSAQLCWAFNGRTTKMAKAAKKPAAKKAAKKPAAKKKK